MVEEQWVLAKDLREGDVLSLAYGTTAVITKAYGEQFDEPVIVYNFEVCDFHTYYVTNTGVLVHNDQECVTLFRGERSSNTPDKAFNDGFEPKGTHNDPLLHTQSNTTPGNFVSTSKSKEIATDFAGKNGYVYEVRTNNYIDINSTYGNRVPFPEQQEFSIPGGIKPDEIVGAYKKQGGSIIGDMIINPNYGGGK